MCLLPFPLEKQMHALLLQPEFRPRNQSAGLEPRILNLTT
jgi:hypothetical protein